MKTCGSAWGRLLLAGLTTSAAAISDLTAAETFPGESGTPLSLVAAHAGGICPDGEENAFVVVAQGTNDAVTIDYELAESDGPWRGSGHVTGGRATHGERLEIPLKLTFPHHGLFRLKVTARAGSRRSNWERPAASLYAPEPVSEQSPWGVFFVPPSWFARGDPRGAEREAEIIRLVGASWVRFGFWEPAFGKVRIEEANGRRTLAYDPSVWKHYAESIHQQQLFILGGFSQMPRALSSRPAAQEKAGDGGALFNRVKPADYGLWDQLMENVARDFSNEISWWEIWNEPDNQGVYFSGSHEEFAELARHTSAALRRGNRKAKIASAGFSLNGESWGYGSRLLELGLARDIDVFTVHYTDQEPWRVPAWKAILKNHQVALPIWDSEDQSILPLFDRMQGVPHTFKFLAVVLGGYESAEPLMNRDFTLRPEAIAYSVAAHGLRDADYDREEKIAGGGAYFFHKGDEKIVVLLKNPLAKFAQATHRSPLRGTLRPLSGRDGVTVDGLSGRARVLKPDEHGHGEIDFNEDCLLLTGASEITFEKDTLPADEAIVVEAESGHYDRDWRERRWRGASGQRLLELKPENGDGQFAVKVSAMVPTPGRYELCLAAGAYGSGQSVLIAPFSWRWDQETEVAMAAAPPEIKVPGYSVAKVWSLGVQPIDAGEHTFELKVNTARFPRNHYRFDALVLRRVP